MLFQGQEQLDTTVTATIRAIRAENSILTRTSPSTLNVTYSIKSVTRCLVMKAWCGTSQCGVVWTDLDISWGVWLRVSTERLK